ncbi:hypothetical protein AAKU58_000240 [Oxalobacteraceae bacterium GrIS 1.18]
MTKDNRPLRGPKMTMEELKQHFIGQELFDITRPIVLFNKYKLQAHGHEIPAPVLLAAGESEESIQRAIVSPDQLENFNLSKNQQQQFLLGEPILLHVAIFEQSQPQASGGQRNTPIEKHIKIAAAATLYVVVERLNHLLSIRDGIEYESKVSMRDITMRFVAEYCLEDVVQLKPEIEHTIRHLRTLWEKGRRPEIRGKFYSIEAMERFQDYICDCQFSTSSKPILNQEIDFQRSLIHSLLQCELRSATLRQTLSNVSDKIAGNHPESKGDRALLAGVHQQEHYYPVDVLPAAFAGDFNPAELFPNLHSASDHFEVMIRIGRLHRDFMCSLQMNICE